MLSIILQPPDETTGVNKLEAFSTEDAKQNTSDAAYQTKLRHFYSKYIEFTS